MHAHESDVQAYWEGHYGERDRVWSGRVNVQLASMVGDLAPGRALDLGCGEGGDAVWLAERGWNVVAVDVSETALRRAAGEGRTRGVLDRIDFQHHDLSDSFPDGVFDLVSAQFLHSTVRLERPAILRKAARAVAPGGLLVIVDHGAAAAGFHQGAARPPVSEFRRGARRAGSAVARVGPRTRRDRGQGGDR